MIIPCLFTTLALTTVAQDYEGIGKAPVSRLVALMNNKGQGAAPQFWLFEATLKLRDSA